MNSIDIYKLLKYYNNNRESIIESITLRNLENNIDKIDSLIVSLKNLNHEFNRVTRERNEHSQKRSADNSTSKSIREAKSKIGKEISATEKLLKNMILSLPNNLEKNATQKDIVIFEAQRQKPSLFGMKFTDYTNRYCFTHYLKTLFLNSELSLLKNDLTQYFIKKTLESGFNFIAVPYIASREDLEHSGQLPKFENSLYRINEKKAYEQEIFLIPTSEVTLCRYLNFINIDNLPILLSSYTPCFRNETATASKINKPLIRQAHFDKVETFIVCTKAEEKKYLDFCLQRNIKIIETLGLVYRIVKIGAEEMSTTATIQYDIEVYMPRSDLWIEIASCSSCGNYQLYKNSKFKNHQETVSINCSSFPIERIVAILIEYYYTENFCSLKTLQSFLKDL